MTKNLLQSTNYKRDESLRQSLYYFIVFNNCIITQSIWQISFCIQSSQGCSHVLINLVLYSILKQITLKIKTKNLIQSTIYQRDESLKMIIKLQYLQQIIISKSRSAPSLVKIVTYTLILYHLLSFNISYQYIILKIINKNLLYSTNYQRDQSLRQSNQQNSICTQSSKDCYLHVNLVSSFIFQYIILIYHIKNNQQESTIFCQLPT
eukprot:TRINITY_DN17000_c0_g1_i7.p2 TRINITY_DN17000_c0_g1~~TRINITY_DN17000_c0_g1_i7.p2  ORF type:complete len:207 (-),score=-32.45 TRINITY_DN17000_c0_g1_i7:1134-1754(-)